MGLTATYHSNFVQQKEGKGKGKLFHLYKISGSTAELKEYVNSKEYKEYGLKAEDGTPLFKTMYEDIFNDVLPLMLKWDKSGYTLDQSESRRDTSRIEKAQSISPALATAMANRVLDKCFGTSVSTSATNALFSNAEPKADAELGKL